LQDFTRRDSEIPYHPYLNFHHDFKHIATTNFYGGHKTNLSDLVKREDRKKLNKNIYLDKNKQIANMESRYYYNNQLKDEINYKNFDVKTRVKKEFEINKNFMRRMFLGNKPTSQKDNDNLTTDNYDCKLNSFLNKKSKGKEGLFERNYTQSEIYSISDKSKITIVFIITR